MFISSFSCLVIIFLFLTTCIIVNVSKEVWPCLHFKHYQHGLHQGCSVRSEWHNNSVCLFSIFLCKVLSHYTCINIKQYIDLCHAFHSNVQHALCTKRPRMRNFRKIILKATAKIASLIVLFGIYIHISVNKCLHESWIRTVLCVPQNCLLMRYRRLKFVCSKCLSSCWLPFVWERGCTSCCSEIPSCALQTPDTTFHRSLAIIFPTTLSLTASWSCVPAVRRRIAEFPGTLLSGSPCTTDVTGSQWRHPNPVTSPQRVSGCMAPTPGGAVAKPRHPARLRSMLPRRGVMLPRRRVMLPCGGVLLPRKGVCLPLTEWCCSRAGMVLPSPGQLLPLNGNGVTPHRSVVIPPDNCWPP